MTKAWLYTFDPTGSGVILCHRWFGQQYRGPVSFTPDTPLVMACFSPREREEWDVARELEVAR